MKSKQEVIQEAYGEYWEGLSGAAKVCALTNNGIISPLISVSSGIPRDLITYNDLGFRPRSLQGIETNNGWTRIDSESDLPKEDGTYYVMTKDGMKSLYLMSGMGKSYNVKKWMEYKATHYQLQVVPKPPIY